MCTRLFLGIVLPLLVCGSAHAETECSPAGAIAPGLEKLIYEFREADRAGTAVISVHDFLVGVSDIPPQAARALDLREPAVIKRTGSDHGTIDSDGATVAFQGMFAGERTYFQVPRHVHAKYVSSATGLFLYYDSAEAIRVGHGVPILDVPLYRTINHVQISRQSLSFFWEGNTGLEPDRCFVPAPR